MSTKAGSYSFVVRDRFDELKANAAESLVTKVPQKEDEGTITEQAERVECSPKTVLVALNACRLKCRLFDSGKDRVTLLSNDEVDEWLEADLFAAEDAGATDFDTFSQDLSDALVKGESEHPDDLEPLSTFIEVLNLDEGRMETLFSAIKDGTLNSHFPNGEDCPEGVQVSEEELNEFLMGTQEMWGCAETDHIEVILHLPQDVAALVTEMDVVKRQRVEDLISEMLRLSVT